VPQLCIAQDAAADGLLALIVGMLLDQHASGGTVGRPAATVSWPAAIRSVSAWVAAHRCWWRRPALRLLDRIGPRRMRVTEPLRWAVRV